MEFIATLFLVTHDGNFLDIGTNQHWVDHSSNSFRKTSMSIDDSS